MEAKAVYPVLKSNIGRRGTKTAPVTRRKSHFVIEDEILRVQSSKKHKTLCLQKVKHLDDGRVELRFGYYIIGGKPKMKGK